MDRVGTLSLSSLSYHWLHRGCGFDVARSAAGSVHEGSIPAQNISSSPILFLVLHLERKGLRMGDKRQVKIPQTDNARCSSFS